MWNFADDCGHIQDEPLKLKLQILSADDVDAADLIEQLITAGLVERLAGCLLIKGFEKHQKVDRRGACRFTEALQLPPNPPDSSMTEGKGVERKGTKKRARCGENAKSSIPTPVASKLRAARREPRARAPGRCAA